MKKSSKNISQVVNSFFEESPTLNQKAWGVINQFYHIILTYMDENNISQSDLAKKLQKSRSAISQLFSKTPNISVKKMVEIADAIGVSIEIYSPQVEERKNILIYKNVIEKKYPIKKEWNNIHFKKETDNYINISTSEKEVLTIPTNSMDEYTEYNLSYN